MFWLLFALAAIVILCSRLAPGSDLARSAADAFDSNVRFFARYGAGDDASGAGDDVDAAGEGPAGLDRASGPGVESLTPPRALAGYLRARPTLGRAARETAGPIWKTSVVRKRPTPLMQKKVAVRYGFRCALCNEPLDETWETDHIVPLSEARTMRDAEMLNSIDNLQPVHRKCHQLKTSNENTRAARGRPR